MSTDDDRPGLHADEDGHDFDGRPPEVWSDRELIDGLRKVEALIESLSTAYERLAAERDKRAGVYREVLEALGLPLPGGQ